MMIENLPGIWYKKQHMAYAQKQKKKKRKKKSELAECTGE